MMRAGPPPQRRQRGVALIVALLVVALATVLIASLIDRGEHQVVVSLDDGRKLCAPLLVGAEGRNSPSREAAGIGVRR